MPEGEKRPEEEREGEAPPPSLSLLFLLIPSLSGWEQCNSRMADSVPSTASSSENQVSRGTLSLVMRSLVESDKALSVLRPPPPSPVPLSSSLSQERRGCPGVVFDVIRRCFSRRTDNDTRRHNTR